MSQNQKTIAENRKARHEYELYDRFEAGLVLQGTEIKSIRRGKVQLKDSYISFRKAVGAMTCQRRWRCQAGSRVKW